MVSLHDVTSHIIEEIKVSRVPLWISSNNTVYLNNLLKL